MAQNPLDWLTQLWNIVVGRRVDPARDAWLLGPIGDIGGIADRFVERLAREESLTLRRNPPHAGLMEDFRAFGDLETRIHPAIRDFYCATLDYDFEVWTQWRPFFNNFGCLVYRLFSSRIHQLNLPRNPLDTARGLRSEILYLEDGRGRTVYRVWYRRLKTTGEVVYSGVYSHCLLPDGEPCLKIIFPLPQGSATVVMRATAREDGSLLLASEGRHYGGPGFYLIVKDSRGGLWQNLLRSFHEHIHVYVDEEGVLRADHAMRLWGLDAYRLHYRLNPRFAPVPTL